MARVTYTERKIWYTQPTLSDFVTELVSLFKYPKYVIKVYYAFEAIYYAFIERKIYFIIYSQKVKGWVLGFIHLGPVQKNYIPYIQDCLRN